MPSDTNPLPAAQLLALADAAIRLGRVARNLRKTHDNDGRGTSEIRRENAANKAAHDAEKAYRAARAASPVTLEEFLIVQEEDAQWCRTTVEWIEAVEMTHKHALVLIDAREHARRLAGEGGAA